MSGRNAWYFDFISPFAYLQLEQVMALEDLAIEACPLLFAGLLKHHGQLGPAEIPAKRRFTYRYVTWAARRQGIELRFPPAHPFNPLHMLRLCVALGSEWPVVQRMFQFVWRDGRDPAREWPSLCEELGLEADEANRRAASDPVKQQLRGNTEEAIGQGVFGVPTLVLGGELFWGVDATAMALEFANDPVAFESDAMRALDSLPEAASRSR